MYCIQLSFRLIQLEGIALGVQSAIWETMGFADCSIINTPTSFANKERTVNNPFIFSLSLKNKSLE